RGIISKIAHYSPPGQQPLNKSRTSNCTWVPVEVAIYQVDNPSAFSPAQRLIQKMGGPESNRLPDGLVVHAQPQPLPGPAGAFIRLACLPATCGATTRSPRRRPMSCKCNADKRWQALYCSAN